MHALFLHTPISHVFLDWLMFVDTCYICLFDTWLIDVCLIPVDCLIVDRCLFDTCCLFNTCCLFDTWYLLVDTCWYLLFWSYLIRFVCCRGFHDVALYALDLIVQVVFADLEVAFRAVGDPAQRPVMDIVATFQEYARRVGVRKRVVGVSKTVFWVQNCGFWVKKCGFECFLSENEWFLRGNNRCVHTAFCIDLNFVKHSKNRHFFTKNEIFNIFHTENTPFHRFHQILCGRFGHAPRGCIFRQTDRKVPRAHGGSLRGRCGG